LPRGLTVVDMPDSTTGPDRGLIGSAVAAAVLFAWLAFRIFDARDQLDHYGVDPTAAGAAAGWLALATALAYAALIALLLRRAGNLQVIALAPLVPAAVSVLYALVLGGGNTQKVGFPAGSLMFFAVVSMVAAVIASARVVSYARA
jgi:hypothetical protein